jgi:hypothetical protein
MFSLHSSQMAPTIPWPCSAPGHVWTIHIVWVLAFVTQPLSWSEQSTSEGSGLQSLPPHHSASISVSKTQEPSPVPILTHLHLQFKSKGHKNSGAHQRCHKNRRPYAQGPMLMVLIGHGWTLWLKAFLPSLKQWNCIRKERVFALSCVRHLCVTRHVHSKLLFEPFQGSYESRDK